MLPGRNASSSDYRYGFNGKEKDDEIDGVTGSKLDFGARIYDSRLGRFMTTDPYESTFSAISPYSYALNNPIRNIDRDGLWPLDANLHIMIGKYGESTILNEGDWTVIRATSLAEAAKLMAGGKVYDNLLISTHGAGVAGGTGGFQTGGGENITNKELSKEASDGVSSIQLAAFSEVLNYIGEDANIALGACNSANSEKFNKLIYDYLESKLGSGFTFYASTARIRTPNKTKPEPVYKIGLVNTKEAKIGLGFRKIGEGGIRSDETFNLRVGKENPWFSSVFNFSPLDVESKLKITSPKNGGDRTTTDKGSDTQEQAETVYRRFESDPNDQ